MERIKSLILISILLGFVVLSCYFFYTMIFSKPMQPILNQYKPDVIINDITSISFNTAGTISTHVSAPQMTYTNYTKQASFTKPYITVYQDHAAPWVITANSGTADQTSGLYRLIGHVLLIQGPSKKSKSILISTSELTIYPDKHIAETDKSISFTQVNQDNSKITVHSIGAIANQKTGQVITKSHPNARTTINLQPGQPS